MRLIALSGTTTGTGNNIRHSIIQKKRRQIRVKYRVKYRWAQQVARASQVPGRHPSFYTLLENVRAGQAAEPIWCNAHSICNVRNSTVVGYWERLGDDCENENIEEVQHDRQRKVLDGQGGEQVGDAAIALRDDRFDIRHISADLDFNTDSLRDSAAN